MATVHRSLFMVCILFAMAVGSIADERLESTADPGLENRLAVTNFYKTRRRDTLKSVARLLYGHESWWNKLRAQNPELSAYEEDQPIPEGTSLQYRAPKIASTYTVQPNDWLIRILLWKYGSSGNWEKILKRNAAEVSHSDLIHPGDVLSLGPDGTVRQVSSGHVLIAGLGPDAQEEIEHRDSLKKRTISSLESRVEEDRPIGTQLGWVIVILFILLVSFITWALRAGYESPVKPKKRIHRFHKKPAVKEFKEFHGAKVSQEVPKEFKNISEPQDIKESKVSGAPVPSRKKSRMRPESVGPSILMTSSKEDDRNLNLNLTSGLRVRSLHAGDEGAEDHSESYRTSKIPRKRKNTKKTG